MNKRIWFFVALLFSTSALTHHGGLPQSDQPLVIDVRTVGEFQSAHILQAINIPYNEIANHIASIAPDRDREIIVYCRSGRRSGIAKNILQQMGYRQIENGGGLHDMLRGGYRVD